MNALDLQIEVPPWRAPAKINLTLAVLGRRGDGFHEIESWAVPIAWYDHLQIAPASGFHLQVQGPRACAADDTNLVHRAAHLLAAEAGCRPDAHIVLTKEIPAGAGLGGGSSDAAMALLALSQMWGLDWPRERLAATAAQLGSDVPYFLDPRSAMMRGRGEQIEPVALAGTSWVAVVVPPYSLSTAVVYRRHSEIGRSVNRGDRFEPAQASRQAREIMLQLFNDLEAAAFDCEPRLAKLKQRLESHCDRPIRMSGSGSSLFTLFDERAEAEGWAASVLEGLAATCEVRVVQIHAPNP